MIDLGTLGGTAAGPAALNNRSQVIGGSNLADDQISHPFLWERGKMMDLSTDGVGGVPIRRMHSTMPDRLSGLRLFPEIRTMHISGRTAWFVTWALYPGVVPVKRSP